MYEVSKQRCKGMLLSSRKVELLIYTDEDGTHIKIYHFDYAVGWDFNVFISCYLQLASLHFGIITV